MGCMASKPAKVDLDTVGQGKARKWDLKAYNTDELLGKAFYFFEAQESGSLRPNHRVKWRGNSYMKDGFRNKLDLVGGWHDAGDHLKLMFPMCWMVAQIAWAMVDGADVLKGASYGGKSNYAWAMQTLVHGVDFLMRCHFRDDAFVIQVGDVAKDHNQCLRAEKDNVTPRPVIIVDMDHPGADAFAIAAAALAAAHLALQARADRPPMAELSDKCLQHAKTLYKYAGKMRMDYCENLEECAKTYRAECWQQFMFYAAAWLYKATRLLEYKTDALDWQMQAEERATWPDYSWQSVYFGACALLYSVEQDKAMAAKLRYFADSHMGSENGIKRTPCGMTFVTEWGSCRHAAGAAAIMAVYARHLAAKDAEAAAAILKFAQSQIAYILGAGGHSWVVGFGRDPPRCPHHRDSALTMEHSGNWDRFNASNGNPNELTGALCGGPLQDGTWKDDVRDYKANEVALDYNAALVIGTVQCLVPVPVTSAPSAAAM